MRSIGDSPDRADFSKSLRLALMPWIVTGSLVIALAFLGLGGWASMAPIAQAVVANGAVRVDTNRKRIQHQEGGTVRDIYVRDGDHIKADTVLVRLDDTRAAASLGIVRSGHDAELARYSRLNSEKEQLEAIVFPPELLARGEEPSVSEILSVQRSLFEARREARDSAVEILSRQISQLREQREGIGAQLEAFERQATLVQEEIESVRALIEPGYIDKPRLLALEREAARVAGEQGELTAERAETGNAIAAKEQEILQLRYDYNQSVVDELRDSQSKLLDLRERLDAAQYVVDNIDIRAPVDGIVVGLAVFSEGEVIRPGDTVLELVPVEDALTIEARVRVVDIDSLSPGLPADIRFTAFDTRDTPVIEGRVDYISADALEDERTGQSYFKARLQVDPQELDKLEGRPILPGMPADVIIKTGERTVLQYLYQPISDALAKAWTEE